MSNFHDTLKKKSETLRELRERLNTYYSVETDGIDLVDHQCQLLVAWPRISKALEEMLQWIEDHKCEAEFCSQCRDLLASLNRGE